MTSHQHSPAHHHQDLQKSWGKRLIASMVMNLMIPAVQIYGGIISGSMALISDAMHNLSDFASLVINYLAVHITLPDQMLGQVDELANQVRTILLQKFKIDHPTLQFEINTCNNRRLLCATSDNERK